MAKFKIDYSIYTFKAEDKRGYYKNGKYHKAFKNKKGYIIDNLKTTDGIWYPFLEHIIKWEYFNGEIPEGLEVDHIIPVQNGGTNELSNLRIGTHKFNMNNETTIENMKKRIRTDEHIENLLEAHRKKRKKIYQYTKNLELVKVWDWVQECEESGFLIKGVCKCCRGERKTYKGYIWSYEPL